MKHCYESKYIQLYENDGWEFASRNKPGSTVVETGLVRSNAVCVVAITAKKELVVISQIRKIVGLETWELPAGLVDSGETELEAATRELKEETGMEVVDVFHVMKNILSSPGLTDEAVTVVFANVDGVPTNEHQEEEEDITVYLMSKDQLIDLRDSGKPLDAKLAFAIELLTNSIGEKLK